MIAKIYSAIPYGFEGRLVEVESDMNRGLPAFNIVGMANRTVNEAKERVRSAIVNSEFRFPDKRVTVNLAPAELLKDGAYLDLPIALSILLLSGQLVCSDVANKSFVGELSLDGELRPVRGIINVVETARDEGYKEIYVPIQNLAQASLVSGITIYGIKTLQELFLGLKGQLELPIAHLSNEPSRSPKMPPGAILDHIRGQEMAKRAMSIAVAGRHNILISGPPGAGKTLLAKAAANLLPDPTADEICDITKLYSLSGQSNGEIVHCRPFRSPHHTASATSIIGGASGPGEISLAHHGVLFLDEMAEFPRSVLESLRQPLEDKKISISRANRKTTYPADFMLIATMNPCPCGYLGDRTRACKCTAAQIQNYQRKLSGPLLDRIDMHIIVEKVANTELSVKSTTFDKCTEHNVVKNTITDVILRQKERYGNDAIYNGSLSSFEVANRLKITPGAEELLATASKRLSLSARAYFKTIKVAQTIADFDISDEIRTEHIAEALTYRRRTGDDT